MNSLIYKEWAKYLVRENLTLVNKSYVTSDDEELESDIIYKANLNNREVEKLEIVRNMIKLGLDINTIIKAI